MRFRDGDIWDEYVRGWVPPGYDNLGPGNEVRIGPAGRSEADANARDHDIRYGNEEEGGTNPYVNWVAADDSFLEELPIEGPSTAIAKALFSAKKAAKSVGLLGDMSGKRKRKGPPPRASPWEQGQDLRIYNKKKQQKRAAQTGRDRAYETIQRYRSTGEWNPEPGEEEAEFNGGPALPNDDDEDMWNDFTVEDVRNGWNLANPIEGPASGPQVGQTALTSEATPVRDVGLGGRPGRAPLPNLPASAEPMDTSGPSAGGDDPMGEEAAVARIGGGGPNSVSKETPISPYPSLTFGLQETHTTILPWTAWLSVSLPQWTVNTQTQMKMRMNSPYDMLESTLQTAPGVGAAPTVNGLYGYPFDRTGKRVNNGNVAFPQTIASGANAGERPQWRDYWAQMYDFYTVLGCEYKITLMNPSDSQGQNLIVGTEYDSYSATATSTGNVMPVCSIADAMGFKGMRWDVIMSNSPDQDQSIATIKGRYKPGQTKRNIINDGDVKTWTAIGSVPNLTESLVLNFWRAPLQYYDGAGIAAEATQPHCLNMQVELKYIVQYKDLKLQARYPNRATTGQTITQILSEDSTATGSAHQRW